MATTQLSQALSIDEASAIAQEAYIYLYLLVLMDLLHPEPDPRSRQGIQLVAGTEERQPRTHTATLCAETAGGGRTLESTTHQARWLIVRRKVVDIADDVDHRTPTDAATSWWHRGRSGRNFRLDPCLALAYAAERRRCTLTFLHLRNIRQADDAFELIPAAETENA